MWDNLLALQTNSAQAGAAVNKDEYIVQVATDILTKLPPIWDVIALRKEAGINLAPTKVVLFQELERFNRLILKIADTLTNLKRALKGEIGMSSDLDELSVALFNGFLPSIWRRLAPATEKKLGSWMEHFTNRIKLYTDWCTNGEPAVMWLSGLHIPESYITALVQTTCRARSWALDKSTLYSVVTKVKNADEFKKKPEHGCYIRGLFLEGAQWNLERNCLQR